MEYFLDHIAKLKVEEYTLPLKCTEFIKMKKNKNLTTQFITLYNTYCEEGKTEEKKRRMGDKEGNRVPSFGNKKNSHTTLQTTGTKGLL